MQFLKSFQISWAQGDLFFGKIALRNIECKDFQEIDDTKAERIAAIS